MSFVTICPKCKQPDKLIVHYAKLLSRGLAIHPETVLEEEGFEADPKHEHVGFSLVTEDERVRYDNCGAKFELKDLDAGPLCCYCKKPAGQNFHVDSDGIPVCDDCWVDRMR